MRLDIIEKICNVIIKNEDYLTELDRAIGDGDHGVNLTRGMEKIKQELPKFQNLKPFEVLNKCAMTLMSNVGGASGALYASGLMKGAIYLKGKEEVTLKEISETWSQVIMGIENRGKATLGEKTMLDTLIPACEIFKERVEEGDSLKTAFIAAEIAGKLGMEATKPMLATKGRAAYLGERSIDHVDSGAASSYLILKTIAESI